MDTLVLDGKNYVRASRAAEMAGYTADYVGQLCRSGKIDAHLIGRTWYVNTDQLSTHRVGAKRMARVKAREQVRKAVEAHQRSLTVQSEEEGTIKKSRTYKNFEKRGISYENDDAELIPQVKKLEVTTEREKPKQISKVHHHAHKKTHKKEKKQPNYTVENAGDVVKMSGTLEIVDASDESFMGQDIVVLEPKILETKQIKPKTVSRSLEKEKTLEEGTSKKKTDFLTKLEELEEKAYETDEKIAIDEQVAPANTEALADVYNAPIPQQVKKPLVSVLVVLLVFVLSILSVHFQTTWTFESENKSSLISGYELNRIHFSDFTL